MEFFKGWAGSYSRGIDRAGLANSYWVGTEPVVTQARGAPTPWVFPPWALLLFPLPLLPPLSFFLRTLLSLSLPPLWSYQLALRSSPTHFLPPPRPCAAPAQQLQFPQKPSEGAAAPLAGRAAAARASCEVRWEEAAWEPPGVDAAEPWEPCSQVSVLPCVGEAEAHPSPPPGLGSVAWAAAPPTPAARAPPSHSSPP